MSQTTLIKIACLTAQGIPLLVAAQQGLTLTPTALLVIAVLNLAAGLTLSELKPTVAKGRKPKAPPLSDADVDRITRRGLEVMREGPKDEPPAPPVRFG